MKLFAHSFQADWSSNLMTIINEEIITERHKQEEKEPEGKSHLL